MDPVSVALGTLGLIESLEKILRIYQDRLGNGSGDAAFSEIFGELSILQNVLAESKLLTDELFDQPMSLIIALTRCQKLGVQLEDQFRLSTRQSKMKVPLHSTKLQEPLRRTFKAFKSAVILFRDIGTELVRFSTDTRHC
jgi:hypothetical protein